MPHAVTHVLIPLILVAMYRDFFVKDKKKFPLHYVLIAGIAGLLPDIDILVYWGLKILFDTPLYEVHRTFTHTLFVPGFFLLGALLTKGIKINKIRKHKLTLSGVFLTIAFGSFIHLILDAAVAGTIMPIYPLSVYSVGLNLAKGKFADTIVIGVDAILLVSWLIYLEVRHKISDFI